jgi:hypothetical protein
MAFYHGTSVHAGSPQGPDYYPRDKNMHIYIYCVCVCVCVLLKIFFGQSKVFLFWEVSELRGLLTLVLFLILSCCCIECYILFGFMASQK